MQKETKHNESGDFNLSAWKNVPLTEVRIVGEEYTYAGENQVPDFYFNMPFRRPNRDTE